VRARRYTAVMQPVYLFDDGKDIRPLTGLRASFEVRYGPFSLIERLIEQEIRPPGLLLWGAFIDGGLAALVRERWGIEPNALRSDAGDTPVLLLNGRYAVPDWERLAGLGEGTAIVDPASGDLVAARVPERRVQRIIRGEFAGLRTESIERPALVSRPWHARTFRDAAIADGIAAALRAGGFERVRDGRGPTVMGDVWAAPSARAWPGAILDGEGGPIVLAANSVVRPGAIIVGPAYIGPSSSVLERAAIRPHTSIGPWCKVNGEISGVVFQGYSNKAHDGFLGDSWVGEWVNLGAGTTNSNLLNTYGEVVARATPGGSNERTGEQFLGAMIGDHVKSAICTRIMTGAVIHAGSMLACSGAVSGCIAPFSWVTDEGTRPYRFGKFVDVARAAMQRRGMAPSAAYLRVLEEQSAAPAVQTARERVS
jgi:UDP-N-acetylglucosamine diphosphorylase/glucosamine-1-phosphate N-acetyltransferase